MSAKRSTSNLVTHGWFNRLKLTSCILINYTFDRHKNIAVTLVCIITYEGYWRGFFSLLCAQNQLPTINELIFYTDYLLNISNDALTTNILLIQFHGRSNIFFFFHIFFVPFCLKHTHNTHAASISSNSKTPMTFIRNKRKQNLLNNRTTFYDRLIVFLGTMCVPLTLNTT